MKPKGQSLVLFQILEKQIPTSALQPFPTGYRLANTNVGTFVYFMKGRQINKNKRKVNLPSKTCLVNFPGI